MSDDVRVEPAEASDDIPRVRLDSKEWPVPELAVRQLRQVRTPLVKLTDELNGKTLEELADQVVMLSDEQFGVMCDIVYQGLTRAHPKMARAQFDDMTVTPAEIFGAFLIVRKQSGVFGRSNTPSGEAVAARLESQTGT